MSEKDQYAFAGFPKTTIDPRSHRVIRHDYEQLLTACARLASFAGAKYTDTDGPINDRQEALAVDDLVLFAIHARRLIDNTVGASRFSRVTVPALAVGNDTSTVGIRRIINTIVHYEDIEIIRSIGKAQVLGGRKDAFQALLDGSYTQHMPPVLAIKSAKEKPQVVRIGVLIEVFQKHVLAPIIEVCADQGLYLEEM